jgi:DNA repair protein SbcC/Rad50
MIPISITLEGFLSYKEKQTLNFEDSRVWILTGKNGSGKSTIFDAMRYALYGDQDRGSHKEAVIHYDRDSCSVEFTFVAGGKRLKACRYLKRKGSSTCLLYEYDDDKFKPINDTNSTSGFTQAIEKYVGLNKDAFTWTVLLRQGQADLLLEQLRVTQQKTSKASELLKQLINLSAYEEIHAKAKGRKEEVARDADYIQRIWSSIPEVTEEEVQNALEVWKEVAKSKEALEQQQRELTALIAPSTKWSVHTKKQTELLERRKNLATLLSDPGTVKKNAERYNFLNTFIPLYEEETKTRKSLEEADTLRNQIQKKLEGLPSSADLEKRRAELNRAKEQIAYLQQFTKADQEIGKITKKKKELEESIVESTDLESLKHDLEESETAKSLLFPSERLQEIKKQKQRIAEAKEKETVSHQSAEEDLKTEDKRLSQITTHLETLEKEKDESYRAVSNIKALWEQSSKSLQQRESTRGSLICAYCGQRISKEQWDKDFSDAQQKCQETEKEYHKLNNIFSDAEKNFTEYSNEKTKIESKINQLNSNINTSKVKFSELEKQHDELITQEKDLVSQLPKDRILDLDQLREASERISSIKSEIETLENIQKQKDLLEKQYESYQQQRKDAHNNLPPSPFSLDVALSLIETDEDLQRQQAAHHSTNLELSGAISSYEERKVVWERASACLGDAPERNASLDELKSEFGLLSDAPTQLENLKNAERDSKEIEDELKSIHTEIDTLPEKSRRPVAEIETEIKQCATRLEEANKSYRDTERKHQDLSEQKEKKLKNQATMEATQKQVVLWSEIEKQLGQPLQNWLLKEAEVHILEYANAYLDAFSQGNLALEAQDSSVPLDLVCRNDLTGGDARPLQSLSGSQKFRVAVSLALALGQFALNNSHRIQSVIIDEGFGSLDGEGQREMSAELRNIAERLERLIVVSHQETFADAFSDRYEIKLTEGTSVPSRVTM